jgi:hypothetical protein
MFQGVLKLKKSLAIILSLVVVMSCIFAACSSKTDDESTTTTDSGLESVENEYGFEYVDVTDESGEAVTDKDGNTVTTEVNVQYTTDKNGKTVAKLIDENGEVVTDKNGKDVTVKTDVELTTASDDEGSTLTTAKKSTTASTTATTQKNESTTDSELTTISTNKDKVPSTSATGDVVNFSSDDQQIIKSMLEVPYLYKANYENADGVPISIASHAAIWMAEREGLNTTSYASGTIVLDLFKFYGQTVVNFKTKCNDESGNSNIKYNSNNDTFSITKFEEATHTITIEKIEDLGNNNYYKVTASVSGAKGIKKVYAIIQKNKLDSTLGFSIKALKWK